MISPKYHQILDQKTTKSDLKNLINEVQRSRVAVENITKFQVEGKYKYKIEVLQNELQACVTNINVQSKRHKILYELISILKGQMFKYQKTKKKQQEEEQAKKDKLLTKFQYQIDQILQKHNEEIAKIKNLKDLADSRRSQRVVYSSLFKKLEKQIKYYEEIYKEQLIMSQFIKSKPKFIGIQSKDNKQLREIKANSQCRQLFQIQDKRKYHQQNKKINGQERFSIPRENTKPQVSWNVFITSNKQQPTPVKPNNNNQKKINPTIEDRQDYSQKNSFYSHYNKQQKLAHTKQILKKISQHTNMIDKIKVYSQCANTEQIITHYSELEKENKDLMKKISQYDDQVQSFTKFKKNLDKVIVLQEMQLMNMDQDNLSLLEAQACNQNCSNNQETTSRLSGQLEEIANLLNLPVEKNQNNQVNQQSLKILDQRISLVLAENANLNNEPKLLLRSSLNRQDTIFSQNVVDCLLQKMQKFNNCERILDRQLFQQQYYKQLGRKRQTKSRKEASR